MRSHNTQNFVVIDLGSNSVRMKITQIIQGRYRKILSQAKDYVRLSENMGPERTLKEAPIKRTLAALLRFKDVYDKLPDTTIIALATAAVRQAANQQEFLHRVKAETGIDFTVITGDVEAHLDYLGVIRTLPVTDCLIMDTGGASTELILVQNSQAASLISLPFGSVTISQKFNLGNKITAIDLFNAMTYVEQELTDVAWLRNAYKLPLICLGGSNRSVAKIARRQQCPDPDDLPDIHGFTLPAEDAIDIMRRLLILDKKGREDIPGLTKSRADVIVAGLIPLTLILRVCHIGEIICSNHGLREGALFDFFDKNKITAE
jgi:exopolyphosphatase/guanosine-5'-triphosphate,3'-diphosphate pyrophosphatase